MRYTYKYTTAQHTNAYPARRANPVIIKSIFYKKAYGQYQYSYTYLIYQVFADKFFQVGVTFKKRKFGFFRLLMEIGRVDLRFNRAVFNVADNFLMKFNNFGFDMRCRFWFFGGFFGFWFGCWFFFFGWCGFLFFCWFGVFLLLFCFVFVFV